MSRERTEAVARLDGAMLHALKRLFAHVCTPDELDMIEHYQTPRRATGRPVGPCRRPDPGGVGGIVLAVLAARLRRRRRGDRHGHLRPVPDRHADGLDHLQLDQPLRRAAGAAALDEAAIFLMIAGSYTPFTTQRFEGAVGHRLHPGWSGPSPSPASAAKLVAPRISDAFWSGVYVAVRLAGGRSR